jgi:hypothetical protein
MLHFLSCWHYIFTDYPYVVFGEKGFEIEPISDEVVGGIKTNSIFFTDKNILQSLQFRELLDEEDFVKDQKQKMDRRGSLHDLLRPGLSFRSDQGEDHFLLSGLDVTIANKNPQTLLSGDFELLAQRNSACRISGLFLDLSGNDLDYFCKRLNLQVVEDKIRVNPNFYIFLPKAEAGLAQDFEARKDFPFWAIIIEKKNCELEKDVLTYSDATLIEWQNQQSLLLKQHITHWDVIVTKVK